MTAEVAIMNQQVLILAADSAVTVTDWSRGEKELRFFKGANKLFHISEYKPVGLMIYAQASIHEVPWEIVVKEFRKTLAAESFDTLAAYAPRFFEFVEGHKGLFPDDVRASALVTTIIRDAYLELRHLKELMKRSSVDLPTALRDRIATVSAREPVPPISAEQIEGFVSANLDGAIASITNNREYVELDDLGLARNVAELVLRDIATDFKNLLPRTGIVIGGYGDQEFFPSLAVYDCYGFLDKQLIVVRNDRLCKTISRTEPVAIEPFATTSMINTFRMGIGPDTFSSVQEATGKALREMVAAVLDTTKPAGGPWDFEPTIAALMDSHGKDWFNRSYSEHYSPLARVVSSLPLVELAALARSLIELQSLKERVTQPTETVGGEIDVAAISKHDGFIWMERKHYFRSELNPRYMRRVPQ